jgi:hypothetical protein
MNEQTMTIAKEQTNLFSILGKLAILLEPRLDNWIRLSAF